MTVNGRQLAAILRLSPARITQLKADGIIESTAENKYDLKDCVQCYIEYKIMDATGGGNVDFLREHARLEKARREKAEIQLAAFKKDYLDAADVEQCWNELINVSRERLRRIPADIAPLLVGISDATERKAIIADAIDTALWELSRYTPGQD